MAVTKRFNESSPRARAQSRARSCKLTGAGVLRLQGWVSNEVVGLHRPRVELLGARRLEARAEEQFESDGEVRGCPDGRETWTEVGSVHAVVLEASATGEANAEGSLPQDLSGPSNLVETSRAAFAIAGDGRPRRAQHRAVSAAHLGE